MTGGTGFLGRHLVERLAETGAPPRVLSTRPPAWMAALGCDVVEGSITDAAVLAKAVKGATDVYHLAGTVSRDPDEAKDMYEVHVEGTRRLCEAAKAAGVRRIVLCSSSGTLAVTEDGETVPDETAAPPLEIISKWPYYLSKLYQERAARDACQAGGPELVIVHPTLVLGPGDERLSSTVDVQRFLDGKMPVLPPGGVNFVDARDVAAGLMAAMDGGRPGEHYLLGGPNWTFKRFFDRVADLADKRTPVLTAPARAMRIGGAVMDFAFRKVGRTPPVDKTSAELGTYFWYADDAKARAELKWNPRDANETLHDTVSWLKHGGRGGRQGAAASGRAR